MCVMCVMCVNHYQIGENCSKRAFLVCKFTHIKIPMCVGYVCDFALLSDKLYAFMRINE